MMSAACRVDGPRVAAQPLGPAASRSRTPPADHQRPCEGSAGRSNADHRTVAEQSSSLTAPRPSKRSWARCAVSARSRAVGVATEMLLTKAEQVSDEGGRRRIPPVPVMDARWLLAQALVG